jgi:hypothetical protein
VPRSLDDKLLGNEDYTSSAVDFSKKAVAEPKYQPINQATHECFRGPCKHFWKLIVRMGDVDIGGKIQIKLITQCNAHAEATDLNEQHIYHCGLWWPAFLSWVPESLQSVMRPKLRTIWIWALERLGYDFSWKHWKDDIFESNDKELRRNCSPGAVRVSEHGIEKEEEGVINFNVKEK